VVGEIARLASEQDVPLHEQAIVMRAVRTESGVLTEALDEAGIPYQVRGGTGLFERREAREALGWLRLLTDASDAQAHLRVATDPDLSLPYAEVVDLVSSSAGPFTGALVGLARDKGRKDAAELIEELLATVATESPRASVRAVLDRTGLRPRAAALGGPEGSARLQGLAQLERLALEVLERDPELDFAGLVQRLNGLAQQGVRWSGTSGPREGVQVTTIHSAKGLEFDAVFFVGLTQRNLPGFERNRLEIPDQLLQEVVPSGDAAHDAEMRRLAYVAMTRARKHLYLVRPAENDRGWSERPSPFFREARVALDAHEEAVGSIPAPPLEAVERAKEAFERACQVAVTARGDAHERARESALAAAEHLVEVRIGVGDQSPGPMPPAVVPPAPQSIALTPTALTDYIGCPLRYRFGRVDRVPSPDDAQRKVGTAVHNALEEHYGNGSGGDGERLVERIETHLQESGVAETAAGQHAMDRARHVIPRYHDAYGAHADVLDTELELTMPLGRHRLRMRVDRIDAVGDRVVKVVDYKTASRPSRRLHPDDTLPLVLYAVAIGRQRGGEVQAAFHYVLDREPILGVIVDGPEVDDQLLIAQGAADGIAAQEFEPKPGWHCRSCDFQLICPAVER
jgi:ATP-dependent exoDNAse (exonuclease V) beta subunit